jgi:hypothetical protein
MAPTPLSEFFVHLRLGGEATRLLDQHDIVVLQSDNARILPESLSKTVKAATCTVGDASRWESCSSHGCTIQRDPKRTMTPQKPQRRGSFEISSAARPPRRPQRSAPSPVKTPAANRILCRTTSPRQTPKLFNNSEADVDSENRHPGVCGGARPSSAPTKVVSSAA